MAHSHARKLIVPLLAAVLVLAAVLAYAAVSAAPAAHAATHHHKKHKKKKKHCHYVKKCRKHHKCKRVRKCKKKSPGGAQPKYGGAIPAPSLFGLNTGSFGSSHDEFVADFQNAKNLGGRWLHFTGGSIHFYSNGQPNYSTMDYEVMRTRQLGMGVVISLGGSPNACSPTNGETDFEGCPPRSSGQLNAYKTYLTGLLLHYRNNVDTYESWVEPNHNSFWQNDPNPAQYANLLKTQWSVFQHVNQEYGLHLKLLFAGPSDFGINGADAVLPFTDAVLSDLGGQKAFDAVALHAYRFPPIPPDSQANTRLPGGGWQEEDWPTQIQAYEQEFTTHGYGTPDLWFTEFGWPGDGNAQDAKTKCANSPDPNCPQYYPSLQQQQRNLEDAYADLLNMPQLSFVKAAFWFNLRDYAPSGVSPDPSFFYHYGLLPYDFSPGPSSQPKPAGNAWKGLAAANPTR